MSSKAVASIGFSPAASALLLVTLPSIANAADAAYVRTFNDRNATGEELANAFFGNTHDFTDFLQRQRFVTVIQTETVNDDLLFALIQAI
mgnify:CR=1 FL=1